MAGGVVPEDWVAGCVDGHRRLETVLTASLTDEVARRPSLLDGWSVGHVVTHIARNADAHDRVARAAADGEMVTMYDSADSRVADIEAGSGRGAHELLADVVAAHRRLETTWAGLGHEVWAEGLAMRAVPTTVADMAFLRWREIEVHNADLGLAGAADPWDLLPGPYLDHEWTELTARLAARVPDSSTVVLVPGDRPSRAFGSGPRVEVVRAPAGRILKWLFGRGGDPSWPALTPWSTG